jgi:hypothetical protein
MAGVAAIDIAPQRITASLAVEPAIHTHKVVHKASVVLAQPSYNGLHIAPSVSIHDLLSALVETLLMELRTGA